MMASLSFLANHLWQSTLFAFAAWLLTVAFRNNRAAVRHGIWLAASLKFLIPFSLLVAAGSGLGAIAPATTANVRGVVQQVSAPFAWPEYERPATASTASGRRLSFFSAAIAVVWLCGSAVVLAVWFQRWQRVRFDIRSTQRAAKTGEIDTLRRAREFVSFYSPNIRVHGSSAALEPGVVGIVRPVLVLPVTIGSRLNDAQFHAIIAHEVCHFRRRDNLTSALHMLVESVFWFHPLVWWLGARLIEERERACDEQVLSLGNEPQDYAEAILEVCKAYLESPVACAAGVTGANLNHRIEEIMQNKVIRSLSFGRRALLVTAVGAAIGAPLGVGLLNAPRVVAQGAAVGASLKFEVASIKPSPAERVKPSQVVNPGGILFSHVTLGDCIMAAYGLESRQISGPDWITEDRFDISARSGKAAARDEVMLMLQSLLSDRFKLAFHRTKKDMEAYLLGIGKGELKLRPSKEEGVMNSRIIPGGLSMQHASISDLLAMIRGVVGAPIADSTGLSGRYDFDLIVLDTQDTSDVAAIKMAMVQGGPDRWAEAVARLGLKLESKKVPMDILVIAHAEKPSENPSGRF